jgi:ribonuclease D
MELIQNETDLREVADAVAQVRLFAADTEAAGYHRYHDRMCLLQISTRQDTFLVDTLALAKLDALGSLFASPEHEVILHDADYDLRLLARDYDVVVRGLFDTKIAAQLLGEPAIGLGALVEKYVGLKLDKKHQRADWAQRPLTRSMLEYAAEDTRHLPELRDRLRDRLEELGRLSWAEEEFRLREQVRWEPEEDDPEAYLRVKNTRDLKPRQMAALRELYNWREGIGRKRDVATFRVVGNDVLTAIARALPRDMRSLATTAGVPGSIAERHGAEMLAAVERALVLPESDLPQRVRGPRRPPPDLALEERAERLKRARDAAAESLQLDRGFLMPRQQLEDLARLQPGSAEEMLAIPDMRRWQVEALADRLLAVLER